jgi:class 3 adenylate cyclase
MSTLSDPSGGSAGLPAAVSELAEQLPRQLDRSVVRATLQAILNLGYRIERPVSAASAVDSDPLVAALVQMAAEVGRLDLPALLALWQHPERQPSKWGRVPGLHEEVSQRLIDLGEPLLACDVAQEGLQACPDDLGLNQAWALALARSGASRQAREIVARLTARGHFDPETVGRLARTYKDLWEEAPDSREGQESLQQAHQFYSLAYRKDGDTWNGINAATLSLILGQTDRAQALAREVRARCVAELGQRAERAGEPELAQSCAKFREGLQDPVPQPGGLDALRETCLAGLSRLSAAGEDCYWTLATLGEAELNLRDSKAAEHYYLEAVKVLNGRYGHLTTTRRNARLLARHLRADLRHIEQHFPTPSVVVFSGHRIDGPNEKVSHFPPALEDKVKEALVERLKLHRGPGYASAYCGADILFLEAMLDLKNEVRVVLPYDRERFGRDNVDGYGPRWAGRYREVLGRATQVVTAAKEQMAGTAPGEYANLLALGLGSMRAQKLGGQLVPMVLWDGRPGSWTANVVQLWRRLGHQLEQIDVGAIRRQHLGYFDPGETPPADAPPAPADPDFQTHRMAMLFADAVKFSRLTEQQIPQFVRHFLGMVGELLTTTPHTPVVRNTWGDGLYLVFRHVRDAGLFALELSRRVGEPRYWVERGLPEGLNLRIALHAGPVYECLEPITGQTTYMGTQVSRAARIEPITPAGEVYASEEFAAMAAAERVPDFVCDYVGLQVLPKDAGTLATYHVRRSRR